MVGPSYKKKEKLITGVREREEKKKKKSRHRVYERGADQSEPG